MTDQKQNNAQAAPAVLQATIQIKRKATGKVEEYKITGYPVQPQPEPKKEA